jgi:hypothetical protein
LISCLVHSFTILTTSQPAKPAMKCIFLPPMCLARWTTKFVNSMSPRLHEGNTKSHSIYSFLSLCFSLSRSSAYNII